MAVASADWLGMGRGLGQLAGEGSWPWPIGWGRVVASADWLGKGRSPVMQVAGHVLIRKFEWVSERLLKGRRRGLGEGHRTRWSRLA